MAVDSYAYGTAADVAAYVQHATNNGSFDTTTAPTLAQVESFINQRSAMLNACLAVEGYAVPISAATAPQAYAILVHYVANGAAGDVELSQRSAGYDAEDTNRRENKFLAVFDAGCQFVKSAAFAALAAAQSGPSQGIAGLYVGGRTSTGQRLRPVFTRTTAGNDPTDESGPAEPGWTETRG